MLSRRAFVAGLLAMPAVVHAGNLMSIKGVRLLQARVRSWSSQLEYDGSVSFIRGQLRYLDEWLKTQTLDKWEPSVSFGEVVNCIKEDKKLLDERTSHWKNFTAFQHTAGVDVEAFISKPGAILRDDPPFQPEQRVPNRRYDMPVFHFFEKDAKISLKAHPDFS